jgi:hypothetical protein
VAARGVGVGVVTVLLVRGVATLRSRC